MKLMLIEKGLRCFSRQLIPEVIDIKKDDLDK